MKTSVDVHNYLVERDIPHELVPLQGRVRAPEHVPALEEHDPPHLLRWKPEDGGEVTSVLKIRPGDLLRAVDARVAQIAA